MKKLFSIFCFVFLTNFAFGQSSTWSFQDGYNAGKHYREIDRQDMFVASYNYANEIGQNEYALGLREGWELNAPKPSGGQPDNINIDWDFITGVGFGFSFPFITGPANTED
jgi:hypothetical protein